MIRKGGVLNREGDQEGDQTGKVQTEGEQRGIRVPRLVSGKPNFTPSKRLGAEWVLRSLGGLGGETRSPHAGISSRENYFSFGMGARGGVLWRKGVRARVQRQGHSCVSTAKMGEGVGGEGKRW